MRVLHVLAPAPLGGLERVVASLCHGLAGRGEEVHVAAIIPPDTAEAEHPFLAALRAQGAVDLHPIRVRGRAYGRERAALAALLDRLHVDVVHTHGYRADVVDAPVARERGVATVTTLHGFVGGGVRNRLYEAVQRRRLGRFDAVVAVSRPLAAVACRAGVPRGRVRLIRNAWTGSPAPLSRSQARARLGVPRDSFHIGWVGRLGREKGADVLLRSLPGLGELPWTASLLGSGPERGRLERLGHRLGIAHRLRWHGQLPDAAALLAAFDVFALTSRTEGTPIALLEAIAARVPCVAAAVGGVPDMLGPDEARLVPPEDPAALAAALRAVRLEPIAARDRAALALARLRRDFDAESWLDAYQALYAELSVPTRSPCPLQPV